MQCIRSGIYPLIPFLREVGLYLETASRTRMIPLVLQNYSVHVLAVFSRLHAIFPQHFFKMMRSSSTVISKQSPGEKPVFSSISLENTIPSFLTFDSSDWE